MDSESKNSTLLEQEQINDEAEENYPVMCDQVLPIVDVSNVSNLIEMNQNKNDIGNVSSASAEKENNQNICDVQSKSGVPGDVETTTSEEVKTTVEVSEKNDSVDVVECCSSTVVQNEDFTMEEVNDTAVESKESQDCNSVGIDTSVDNESSAVVGSVEILEEPIVIEEKNVEEDENKQNIDSANEDSIKLTSTNIDLSNQKTEDLFFIDKRTPLEVIAMQYDSSEEEEKKDNNDSTAKASNVSNAQEYRNQDDVVLSSDSSDSESDSDSSSSESDSEKVISDSSEDSSDSAKKKRNLKKNERVKKNVEPTSEYDNLPPIEDLQISVPEVLCDPVGKVAWTVKEMVVVRPEPGKPTLNLDTVLFIDKGQRALGHIFDVFGQVKEPHYCVRFNSSNHIQERDIKVGMTVYFCPNTPYTSLVFLSELTKIKAVDDLGDDDPPQFSDDEEEQAYLASLKNRSKKGKQNQTNIQERQGETPIKRLRGNKHQQQRWQSNHPWNSFRENQQLQQQLATRPFYRTQHPWSRPRYPQANNRFRNQPQQPLPQYIQQANWAAAYSLAYTGAQQAYSEYAYVDPQVAAYGAADQSYSPMHQQAQQLHQQQAVAYQQVDPSIYGQVQQFQYQQADTNSPVQGQQPQNTQVQTPDYSMLTSQYPLIPPPPPPPPQDPPSS